MNPVNYLLPGLVTFSALACWILFAAIRHAVEGYEDEFGFHLGITPAIISLYPATALSAYLPAELARATVPATPKRRRKAGSKPPMLPANLDVNDLNPRPAEQSQQQASKAEQASRTLAARKQRPSIGDQPPTT